MIITRTPFRVSLVGGGTDLPSFYRKHSGAVVTTAIDKYMYIMVNKRFDNTIRVGYSKTEIVNYVDEIEHTIVREALKLCNIWDSIEIVSVADIPASAGLGSSSAFAVGLLNALYAYKGEHKSPEDLARLACYLEIDVLEEPIGKQDQCISAYGGFKYLQFKRDNSVIVSPISYNGLCENLLLLYLGSTRSNRDILERQKANTSKNAGVLSIMSYLATDLAKELDSHCHRDLIGSYLHANWEAKKLLANGITNPYIDSLYTLALKLGATGGKVCGEGGCGFLLLYCPNGTKESIRQALDLPNIEFNFEPEGSKVVYNSL